MHYLVLDGPFDLTELADFDGDLRKLRRHLERLPGVRQHESFGAYQEHWCRVMGIEDVAATALAIRILLNWAANEVRLRP